MGLSSSDCPFRTIATSQLSAIEPDNHTDSMKRAGQATGRFLEIRKLACSLRQMMERNSLQPLFQKLSEIVECSMLTLIYSTTAVSALFPILVSFSILLILLSRLVKYML